MVHGDAIGQFGMVGWSIGIAQFHFHVPWAMDHLTFTFKSTDPTHQPPDRLDQHTQDCG
jgi:hypothetical protein